MCVGFEGGFGPKGLGNSAQASMKPNLSSTRCEKAFFQGLWFIWSEIRQEIGCDRLWCLIGTVRGYEHRNDQQPKSVTLLARSVSGSSEQRNKWQGPVWRLPDGKDAVYAGWELEPVERSAPGRLCFLA